MKRARRNSGGTGEDPEEVTSMRDQGTQHGTSLADSLQQQRNAEQQASGSRLDGNSAVLGQDLGSGNLHPRQANEVQSGNEVPRSPAAASAQRSTAGSRIRENTNAGGSLLGNVAREMASREQAASSEGLVDQDSNSSRGNNAANGNQGRIASDNPVANGEDPRVEVRTGQRVVPPAERSGYPWGTYNRPATPRPSQNDFGQGYHRWNSRPSQAGASYDWDQGYYSRGWRAHQPPRDDYYSGFSTQTPVQRWLQDTYSYSGYGYGQGYQRNQTDGYYHSPSGAGYYNSYYPPMAGTGYNGYNGQSYDSYYQGLEDNGGNTQSNGQTGQENRLQQMLEGEQYCPEPCGFCRDEPGFPYSCLHDESTCYLNPSGPCCYYCNQSGHKPWRCISFLSTYC